jgi:hypothetical protein
MDTRNCRLLAPANFVVVAADQMRVPERGCVINTCVSIHRECTYRSLPIKQAVAHSALYTPSVRRNASHCWRCHGILSTWLLKVRYYIHSPDRVNVRARDASRIPDGDDA